MSYETGLMMSDNQQADCIHLLKILAADVHKIASDHGFWEEDRNDGEMIALIHSELSEALEGIRHGNPPDSHCPEFSSAEVEFADVLIRMLDMCHKRKYRIGEAMFAKMIFNKNRPHKHGKKF